MLALIFVSNSITTKAQNPVNWTEKQLIQPAELAKEINSKKILSVIICVGPGSTIPNTLNIGMVNTPEGITKLKTQSPLNQNLNL